MDKVKIFKEGVCVGVIRNRTGLSQSTVSNFLSILKEAGLVEFKAE